ncbi:MAG: magnesium-translocating P-type ATPase [Sorangiineae bacterium]|nr:magnesium-translocating P-type ATPase [Sorangiineae bacterium]
MSGAERRASVLAAGLDSAEAARRLAEHGPNQLAPRRPRAAAQLLARFRSPLVLILLAASVISTFTGDTPSALIVGVIVLLSVLLDFVQEHRASQAAERLAEQVALVVRVLRDGRPVERPAVDLAPGDVVLLAAGDLVPADGHLLEARDFFVNQAALTGEPYPVERRAAQVPDGAPWSSDDVSAVAMGSSVVSGSGRLLVEHTGRRTAMGQIATSLERPPPPTAFELGTRRFGLLIMRLTVLLVLFTLLVNTAMHRPLLDSFLFAVALAVGLTPELLPMVVSVTLARGALRMSRARVIVKRLSAIQDMGAMDVLCTDKTGTLTHARIRLERHVDVEGRDSARVHELAYLNSFFESGLESPLDEAILAHEAVDVSGWTKLDEVPFDFERRRVSVLLERDGERLLVLKGAPEDVLEACSLYETGTPREGSDGRPPPDLLDEVVRARILAKFDALGSEGFRVLAIAYKHGREGMVTAAVGDESELVFVGFAAFLDPPKESARTALAAFSANRVAVKILTGDNERVTRHVCTELGMPITGVLLGGEIAQMNDDALRARVDEVNLFCRANPQQKNRILLALKARGHVVGYLGDGINDAPSLHTADVGISVDGAVAVARAAAAMILLDNDLNVLEAGLREGRRTFGNVMKYVMMATSSNFGNMFSMALGTLALPFLPMLPTQILLNNFLYDLSELALPLDEVDAGELERPGRWDMDFIRDFMLRIGPISSAFDFATFFILLRVLDAGPTEFRTGWFVESLATQVLVIFIIRTRGSPLRSRPNRWLVLSSLGVVAVAIALPFSPLAPVLGFTRLPAEYFMLLAGLVLAYLALVEGVKRRFFAARREREPA